MPENTPQPENPMTTLVGGENFTVTKHDGSTETVFVKQLSIRKYKQFIEAQHDEAKMIAMTCNKPEEYCDALTPESHIALIETIERVNESFFLLWLQRLGDRKGRLDAVEPKKAGGKPASPTSPPKSPSSAA